MKLRHRLLGLMTTLTAYTPLALSSLLCWCLAWLWWLVVPVRRKVAEDNIAQALPHIPPGARARLLRRSVHDIALGYPELLHFLRDPVGRCSMLHVEGMEHVHPHVNRGQGVIVVGGHGGCWDLMLPMMARDHGIHLACIVKPPSDPWAAHMMERARLSSGAVLISPRDGMARVYEHLESGGVVLFPNDQRHRGGIELPFFGRPALTAVSPAAAARRTGAPVVFAWQHREGTADHVLVVSPIDDLQHSDDRDDDLRANTIRFNALTEAEIRQRPHGWLWLHRRWSR